MIYGKYSNILQTISILQVFLAMVLPILAVQITIDTDAAIGKALVSEVVDEIEDEENQEETNGNSNVVDRALGTLIPVQEGVHPK